VTETLSANNRMTEKPRFILSGAAILGGVISGVLVNTFFSDKPQEMSPMCYKGCAEWKASIEGSLFDAIEPEDCDCDKVTVENVEEKYSEENREIEMAVSNRWKLGVGWGNWNIGFQMDRPQDMSTECFKGCAKWKTSGSGSLFEATEPEGCDCDEVTVTGVTETLSASNRMIESNRGLITDIWNTIWDRPQDMSPMCYKGCAEWKASIGGSLFDATEPKDCDCDKVTLEKVEENFPQKLNRGIWGNIFGGIKGVISNFFGDKPQEMSAMCYKGCAEWKASGGGTLFEATEPKDCDCDKVTLEKVEEDFPVEK